MILKGRGECYRSLKLTQGKKRKSDLFFFAPTPCVIYVGDRF